MDVNQDEERSDYQGSKLDSVWTSQSHLASVSASHPLGFYEGSIKSHEL